ncbi:hypothetical protein [Paludisphaera mucosa]|uniref:Uncharacterized protein n=1 Tax=Paludisphaera mucosa TaxID=3030827 RepID=A0ABT6FLI9_9BACT|nr:hypothetical protein [Paludisphaera mucosa]MDG3008233.1 hypothetical protein [Paludisphaera mucosa]
MASEEKTSQTGMAGASGQRMEPADEGMVVEAAGQVPPHRDAPSTRDQDPKKGRTGESSSREDDEDGAA